MQFPNYASVLHRRLLQRVGLRLEDRDFRHLLEEATINREVYEDLERGLAGRARVLDRRPRLDLGLTPTELLAKVPLFADLSPARLTRISKILKPRLVLPEERVVRQGDVGDAMYFIASGAVEVALAESPVRLGSGDFFGEIALLKDVRRTADVVALGYCRCLVLHARAFQRLMAEDEELRQTIMRVADRRLAELESRGA